MSAQKDYFSWMCVIKNETFQIERLQQVLINCHMGTFPEFHDQTQYELPGCASDDRMAGPGPLGGQVLKFHPTHSVPFSLLDRAGCQVGSEVQRFDSAAARRQGPAAGIIPADSRGSH
eukprot:598505-Hanusia_phi.AAC.1